jgi:hypothetical protein
MRLKFRLCAQNVKKIRRRFVRRIGCGLSYGAETQSLRKKRLLARQEIVNFAEEALFVLARV